MGNMKKLAASLLACAALLLPSCTKGVEHTGDDTGLLYGNWVLDTKTVTTPSTSGAGTDSQVSETSFVNDHFYLCLVEPQLAFGKEGTLLTFDIDDVDAGKFSYNADLGKITFEKIILLSTGFPPRIMRDRPYRLNPLSPRRSWISSRMLSVHGSAPKAPTRSLICSLVMPICSIVSARYRA